MACVFCRIAAGELPAHVVWEGDDLLAFLDIRPLNPGHLLVVPREHVPTVYDLPPPRYAALMDGARRMAGRVAERLQPARVGLMVVGFDVDHAHVHVVPLHAVADLNLARTLAPDYRPPTAEELAAMRRRLGDD
ncbi:MAG: HIT family protein [Actinomycetia bacterium]|nr:HIT family protein [Actinomycetes bacterium]